VLLALDAIACRLNLVSLLVLTRDELVRHQRSGVASLTPAFAQDPAQLRRPGMFAQLSMSCILVKSGEQATRTTTLYVIAVISCAIQEARYARQCRSACPNVSAAAAWFESRRDTPVARAGDGRDGMGWAPSMTEATRPTENCRPPLAIGRAAGKPAADDESHDPQALTRPESGFKNSGPESIHDSWYYESSPAFEQSQASAEIQLRMCYWGFQSEGRLAAR